MSAACRACADRNQRYFGHGAALCAGLLGLALLALRPIQSSTVAAQGQTVAAGSTVADTVPCSISCAVAPGQTVSFSGGQFTVTNQGRVFSLAGSGLTFTGAGPSITTSFDGTVLVLFGVDAQNDHVAGCLDVNGIPTEMQCTNPQGALAFTVPPPNGAGCRGTPVPAGWNLLSGFPASYVNLNVGPIYTFSGTTMDYQLVVPERGLSPKGGYWVLFARATEVFADCGLPPDLQPFGSAQSQAVTVGPGWAMIGDPFNAGAETVSGADLTYTYDPITGSYQQATTLQIGQGAWAYSASGATVTLTLAAP